jgi:hypothetical protein
MDTMMGQRGCHGGCSSLEWPTASQGAVLGNRSPGLPLAATAKERTSNLAACAGGVPSSRAVLA